MERILRTQNKGGLENPARLNQNKGGMENILRTAYPSRVLLFGKGEYIIHFSNCLRGSLDYVARLRVSRTEHCEKPTKVCLEAPACGKGIDRLVSSVVLR